MGRGTVVTAMVIVALGAGGCGGDYTLSTPDHVAPVGSQTAVVIRLQRNDFFVLDMAIRDAPMWFLFGEGGIRAAYTDKQGYAGTSVLVPDTPGRYDVSIKHTDDESEELSGSTYIYAWDAAKPVLAVDLDSLPDLGEVDMPAARTLLRRFALKGNVLYLTRKPASDHDLAHGQIMTCNYPDGPVLLWRRKRWRVVRRGGRFRMPMVVIESRLVSQLAEIKRMFPGLKEGVCSNDLAAKAFAEAGLGCTFVGNIPGVLPVRWYESWQALAAAGI